MNVTREDKIFEEARGAVEFLVRQMGTTAYSKEMSIVSWEVRANLQGAYLKALDAIYRRVVEDVILARNDKVTLAGAVDLPTESVVEATRGLGAKD